MEFKDRMKSLRKQRGLSQRDLAQALKVSYSTVAAWESGTRFPSVETQEDIADYFNVTLDYLYGRDEGSVYYFDPEVAQYAEFLRSNPEYKVLFDASRKVSREDIDFVRKMIEKLT